MFIRLVLLAITASIFLMSCSSNPYTEEATPSVEDRGERFPSTSAEVFDREGAGDSGGSAVSMLIQDVDRQLERGQYEAAAASAERAIRIAPSSPRAYFALAQVRFFQAQYGLSRSLLLKARSLTQSTNMLRSIENFLARPEYAR